MAHRCDIDSPVMLQPNEFESTISIKINKEAYENADGSTDVIFFFKDSSRLSNRRIERKIFINTKRVFGFYDGYVFPINRTTANETVSEIDKYTEVTKATHRKLQKLSNGVRVSYNKEECAHGVIYTVEYEIEYEEHTSYDDIIKYEDSIMSEAVANGHFANTTEMSLENIFACVMTKVQMWHCFDASLPYVWAYKWDGVKAKMIVHEDTSKAYLWKDADNINIVKFKGYHPFLKNLCMVVEVMDEGIVIIEIIGSRFDDCVYLSEPNANIKMLKYLHDIMDARGPYSMIVDNKPLLAQTYFEPPMPKYEPNDGYDGFIVVQDNLVIKWKMPTIDVKCFLRKIYIVADKYYMELDKVGETDAIYEISPSFKIIRKRTDRINSSNEQEYLVFMESIKMLSNAPMPGTAIRPNDETPI